MRRLLALLAVLLLLTGCSSKGKYIEKNAREVREMMDKEETFVLVATKPSCMTCQDMKITLKDLTDDYPVTIYVVDVSDEKYENDINSLIYDYLFRLDFTPTLYFIEEGMVTDLEENGDDLTSINFLVDLLVEHGYIKE